MGALAEMILAHPTTGSFGAFAEHYINPFTGFLLKYLYWSCLVLAVGTEITAVGGCMRMWFPDLPAVVWIIGLSALLIGVNMFNVKAFGTLEYWFSATKEFAIAAFILLAAYLVFGQRAMISDSRTTPRNPDSSWAGPKVSGLPLSWRSSPT